jgi:hypothetical protein
VDGRSVAVIAGIARGKFLRTPAIIARCAAAAAEIAAFAGTPVVPAFFSYAGVAGASPEFDASGGQSGVEAEWCDEAEGFDHFFLAVSTYRNVRYFSERDGWVKGRKGNIQVNSSWMGDSGVPKCLA